MATMQATLARQRREQDALVADLGAVEKDIGRTTRQLRELRSSEARQRERLVALEAERDAAEARLADQRGRLGALLRADHATAASSRLKLWLNQEDPARIGRTLGYFDYLRAARTARIQAVRDSLERLAALRRELEAGLAELERLGQALERERARRLAARDERQRLLQQLEARVRDQQAELVAARQESERLEALLEELKRAFADIPEGPGYVAFASLRGDLAWPVAGTLRSAPGQAKRGGLSAAGALLETRPGAEVRAVAAGRVAYADWLRGFGLLTILDHGDGFMSLYAFCETLFADVGDWIGRGELIGLAGDSGGRAGPGLYFELRKDGEAVDPRRWLRSPEP